MRHCFKITSIALLAACGDASSDDGFATVGLTHAPQSSSGADSTAGADAPTTGGDAPTTGDVDPGTTASTATSSTTSTTAGATCGDGELGVDEQCDLGPANADNGACTSNCRVAVCGDGLVHLGVEHCDDGGTEPGDGCDAHCKVEGDGTVVEVPLTGLALPIPNDGYDGFPGSMACADLPVEAAGVVTDVRVQVGIEHPFIGDLVIKLWSPKGTQLTLMSLPGAAEEADDGKSDSTENSDIVADFPVTFQKDGEIAELMGHTLGIDQAVCRDDGVCDYSPYPGKGPGKDFGDFSGEPASGVWRLCVGDAAFADKGTFESVALTLVL